MPYADPAAKRAYDKARAQQRRALGLCQNCNRKAVEGQVRCADCRERYSRRK